MGRGIIKLNDGKRDWYLEWSTVVDAPVSGGMTKDQAVAYLVEEAKRRAIEAVNHANDGSDWPGIDGYNRAGPNESQLTRAEIIATYCREPADGSNNE